MSKRAALLLLSLLPLSVIAEVHSLPYSEDRAPDITYDATGAWTIGKLAGFAQIQHLNRRQRRHLPKHTLLIYKGSTATLWTPRVMQWPLFATPVLGQTTYDTTSREFWMAFRTRPAELQLPRYVTAVDVEIGYLLMVNPNRAWLDYQGVWYNVSRGT